MSGSAAEALGAAGANPDPVIIAGVPRSGVRLLAAVLDGHPALASGPELPILVTLAQQWHNIHATLSVNHARHYGLAPETSRANFRASALRLVMPRVRAAGKQAFALHSFGATATLDSLAKLFPAARIILMVRDPREVARSLLGCNWRNPRDGTALPYTRDVEAGARLWRDFMSLALQSVPPLEAARRITVLRYEDLCSRPQESMARIGELLRLPAPESRLSPASAQLVTVSSTDPHPPLQPGEIVSDRVRLWPQALTGAQARAVERMTETLRQRLGYR